MRNLQKPTESASFDLKRTDRKKDLRPKIEIFIEIFTKNTVFYPKLS